jgi:hypothetical protein
LTEGSSLKQACGDDAALRHEVESLLAQEARSETFIEQPALVFGARVLAQDAALLAELEPPPMTGTVIAHYRVFEKLGEGGLQKPGLNSTSLLGMSKLGWLKILNALTSYLSEKRSFTLNILKAPTSKRFWKGPRKMLRPPVA